jgi:hypothetical protein
MLNLIQHPEYLDSRLRENDDAQIIQKLLPNVIPRQSGVSRISSGALGLLTYPIDGMSPNR